MSEQTQEIQTTEAPPVEASPIDRAVDAMLRPPEPPAQEAAPEAPPATPAPEPPKAPAQQPQIDQEAIRRTQERAHAEMAAKLEAQKREIEQARAAIEAERKAVSDAQRLARMAKDDPARFLRETGQDPIDFAKRLAERERLSEVARAEIDSVQSEAKRTREELDALRKQLEEQRGEATKAARAQAMAELQHIAGAKYPAAADGIKSGSVDQAYLDGLADEIRTERGWVTLEAVAERLDLRMREAARSLLGSTWGRELAAEIVGKATSPTAPAPTGQDARAAAPPPRTLTRSVTDATSAAPAKTDPAAIMERALDIFTGRARG